jgi:hypothetical protein
MVIFALLVLGTIAAIASTVLLSWMGLVPIVVCMEDDKRGTQALSRAYEILRGHWIRITSLMALVGFAILALYLILLGSMALLMGLNNIKDIANGRLLTNSTFIIFLLAFGGSATLLGLLYQPLYQLILTVFYLDVRVRQEALDLEWTAHVTAPAAAPVIQEQGREVAQPLTGVDGQLTTAPSTTGSTFAAYVPQAAPVKTERLESTSATSPFEVSGMSADSSVNFVDAQPRTETVNEPTTTEQPSETPRTQW